MPVEVAAHLMERDIDAVTARDLEMLGSGDRSLLEWATERGRVLCTYDTDYIEMAATGLVHSGIVFIPGEYRDNGILIRYFVDFCRIYKSSDMVKRLEYLSPTGLRS